MSKEQTTQKKKGAKKYIVIVLTMAILIFLLLPLMDDSTEQNGAASSKKKAIPQIFTSNPLSKLVRQVYHMLAGQNRRQNGMMAARTENDVFIDADITRAAGQQLYDEQNDSVSSASYASNGYVQNEYGEWVLVPQTAPVSSQRGLHEVNASDTAYDRLVRSERQAKWTGQAAKPEIPQSKWARFWKPIKEFFTGKEDTEVLANAGPNSVKTGAFGSRGRSGSNDSNAPRVPGSYGRNMSNQNYAFDIGGTNANSDAILSSLLIEPNQAIENMSKKMLKTAQEMLTEKDFNGFQKTENDAKKAAFEKMGQLLLTKLQTDAQDTKPDPGIAANFLVPAANNPDEALAQTQLLNIKSDCGTHSFQSAFHTPASTSDGTISCAVPTLPYQSDPEAIAQSRLESKEKFSEIFSIPNDVPDIPVLVVLGVTQAGENPFLPKRQENTENTDSADDLSLNEKIYNRYIDWLFEKQGCKENPCVITASKWYNGMDLKDSLASGAMKPILLSPSTDMDSEFMDVLYQDPTIDQEFLLSGKFSLDPYLSAYNVVPLQDVQEQFSKEYMEAHPEQRFAQVYTLTSADALELVNSKAVPAHRVFYGPSDRSSFQESARGADPQKQGKAMVEQLANSIQQKHAIYKQIAAQYQAQTGKELMRRSANKAMQDMKNENLTDKNILTK